MKFILALCFIFIVNKYAAAQDTTAKIVKTTMLLTVASSKPLDTNEVVYDIEGKSYRYYQYQKLLQTGEYAITKSSNNPKSYLRKLTPAEQERRELMSKQFMVMRSPVLQENMTLDIKPLLNNIGLKKVKDKAIVLVFWNTSCPPCTESFTLIDAFIKEQNNNNLVVILLTRDRNDVVNEMLKQKPFDSAIKINAVPEAIQAYQVNTFPSYVVTDKNHVIKYAASGSSSLKHFKEAIVKVLKQE